MFPLHVPQAKFSIIGEMLTHLVVAKLWG